MRFELVPELHYRPRGNADATHDVADLVSLLRLPVAGVWAVSHPHRRLWEVACSPPGGDGMPDVVEPILFAELDLDLTALGSDRNELGMDARQLLNQRQRILSIRRLNVHHSYHNNLLICRWPALPSADALSSAGIGAGARADSLSIAQTRRDCSGSRGRTSPRQLTSSAIPRSARRS